MFGLAEKLSIPQDQLNLVAVLIISFPMSYFFHSLKSASARYAYSLVPGLLFNFFLFGKMAFAPLIFTVVTYFLIMAMGRKCAWPIFFLTIGGLLIFHIQRMLLSYANWDLDISTCLMIMVCKYTSFAWEYADGDPKLEGKLTADQEEHKVVELPSLYHFLSFGFFFPTCIVGPTHTYRDFQNFMELKSTYANIPAPWKPIPSLLLQVAVWAFLTVVIFPKYHFSHVVEAEWAANPFWYKCLFINFAMVLLRGRYYTGFKLAQTNITLCGFSYNGKDAEGKENWERIVLVHSTAELGFNVKDKIDNWNIAVQNWLKQYVYLRITPEAVAKKNPSRAELANHLTFLTSAVWHGVYPGYYFTFIYWAFLVSLARKVFRIRSKFDAIKSPVFYPLKWLAVNTLFNYPGYAFTLLSAENTFKFLKNTYFFGPIIVIALTIASSYLPFFKVKREKTTEKAGVTPGGVTPGSPIESPNTANSGKDVVSRAKSPAKRE